MKLKISIFPSVRANLLCAFQCETPCSKAVLFSSSFECMYLLQLIGYTYYYNYLQFVENFFQRSTFFSDICLKTSYSQFVCSNWGKSETLPKEQGFKESDGFGSLSDFFLLESFRNASKFTMSPASVTEILKKKSTSRHHQNSL